MPALQPRAVADVDALVVGQRAVGGRHIGDRHVGERRRPGRGQSPAGLAGAGEDVGDRGAELLAAEVAEHDRRDIVRPRQRDGRPGVDDHDRAGVRGRDGAHEVVLTTGQIEVLAVVALGLDLRVRADDHDGDVGCRGRSAAAAIRPSGSESSGAMPSVALSTPTSGESTPASVNSARMSIGSPRGRLDRRRQRRRVQERGAEVGALDHGLVVDHEHAVHEQAPVVRAGEAEQDPAGLLGRVGRVQHEAVSGRDRRIAAEPDERARTAVLAEQLVVVGIHERRGEAGLAGARVGHVLERQCGDTVLHHRAELVATRGASGSAERIASSGEMTRSGITVALPPPWVRASRALCPMTAMLATAPGASGRMPSLLSSTAPSTAASWASATPSIVARRHGDRLAERADALGEQQQPQHLSVEIRLAAHGRRARPRRSRAHAGAGPGMARSCAAGMEPRLRTAVQSEIDDAVEAPLRVERVLEQVVLGHRHAVDGVVGAHQRPGSGIHRPLERGEVQLAQRALVGRTSTVNRSVSESLAT